MKRFTLVVLTLLGLSTPFTYGQSAQYRSAMEQGLRQFNEAASPETMLAAANHFERIANAETTDWLAPYYQALCRIMLATQAMNEADMTSCVAHLDQAQAALDRAKTLAPNQSEVLALQGFIYTGRIWPDPQALGAQFSQLAHESFEKAKALDPANPRAYYLQGQLVFFTPAFWGGGAKAALPLLRQAAEKFSGFQPADPLYPTWGQAANAGLLTQAEGQQ